MTDFILTNGTAWLSFVAATCGVQWTFLIGICLPVAGIEALLVLPFVILGWVDRRALRNRTGPYA